MSMINKVRLEEFANGLWAKIKTQIGDNVVNLAYDGATNILTATKKDNTKIELDLSNLATTWGHLEYVDATKPTINLFDNTNFIRGSLYDSAGAVVDNADWNRAIVDIKPGTRYRVAKRNYDNARFVFLESDGTTVVSTANATRTNENGWVVLEATAPTNDKIAKLGFNLHTASNPKFDVMLYEGGATPPTDYIPYNVGQEVAINGTSVRTTFDPRSSALTSKFIDDAIREVAMKIARIGDGIVGLSYNETTNILTATKNDGTTSEVDLTALATTWGNLELTTEVLFQNLIPLSIRKTGYYGSNGNIVGSPTYGSYIVPCTPGKTYRRTNLMGFQNTTCNLRGGVDGADFIKNMDWKQGQGQINGRTYWEVTIPNDDANVTHFTLSFNANSSQERELMVWEATIDPPQAYIPNNAISSVLLEDIIDINFNPTGTNLTSTTVSSAIKELATKGGAGTVKSVNSQNPDAQGNVSLNAGHFSDIYSKTEVDAELAKYVPLTDVENAANKVPRLDANGKLVMSTLPKIAINETYVVTATDQADFETKAMTQTVENGDLVIGQIGAAPNASTKQYWCGDATKSTFSEKFIEIVSASDAVTRVELNQKLLDYVLKSDTGTGANQVLRLDADGKVDDSNLKIATANEINDILNALT